MTLTIVLVFLALLIGYALEKRRHPHCMILTSILKTSVLRWTNSQKLYAEINVLKEQLR